MEDLSYMWEVWLEIRNLISNVSSETIYGLENYSMKSRRVLSSENFI
jgi:hypothetical protein